MNTILTDDEIDALELCSATKADVQDIVAAVLAKLEQQEPVAWWYMREFEQGLSFAKDQDPHKDWQPLFPAPQQADRQRVPGPTNNYHQLREALISADQAMAESGLLACHAVRIQIRAALDNAAAPEAPAQDHFPDAGKKVEASAVDERAAFEAWYSQNAFNFERDPIGSRECGLQWKAWQARAALAQKGGAA